MRQVPVWRRYLRLFGLDPAADVDDELRFHVAKRIEDLEREGLSTADARVRAAREFGNVDQVRRELREIGARRLQRDARARWWEAWTQDLRFAARTLRKSPGFALVVIITLALGIGGTTAVFSAVQAVLLAPLPYETPGQLVRLYQQDRDDVARRGFLTGAHVALVREHAAAFEDLAAIYTYRETGLDLVQEGRAERLRVLRVTSGYFDMLRAGALRGRSFDRADEAGTRRVVVLSEELWRRQFGGDPAIIGSKVLLNAEPYDVAGVAPAGIEDPLIGKVDAWLPYPLSTDTDEENHSLSAIARLRNGVTIEQARAELDGLNRSMAERWPHVREIVVIVPLKEDLVASSRGTLQLLLIAVGLLLLVACVNVANLFLVRSTGRVHEFAVRAALGSGGFRIARQLLVESLLLSALGGLLGLGLAIGGAQVLRALGRDAMPRLDEVGLDPVVLGFAALVTVATGIAFGMAPAVRFARVHPSGALREQSRSATGSRAQGRVRGALAAAQLALALTLLVGAGVLMASFVRLQQVDPGFRVSRVLTFDVSLPSARYDGPQRAAFQEALARRLETIPGVTAAGGTSHLPATGTYHSWGTHIETGPLAGRQVPADVEHRTVSGHFFTALAIPLRAGRVFGAEDNPAAPLRAVVSAGFARVAFPGLPLDQVIGQRIRTLGKPRVIVGVAGDVALDARDAPSIMVYHAHAQGASDRNWALTQVVAADLPPEQLLGAVRSELAALDPQLVVYRPAPMAEVVGRGVSRERFALVLMVAFAVVALLLAALGLYGVLAYSVRQRTQEIGIRMALGASAGQVRALVLRQAAAVAGAGLAVGFGGALLLARGLSSFLFRSSPWDPRVLGATMLLLTIVAFLASWLPAWRASRVEPRTAMLDAD